MFILQYDIDLSTISMIIYLIFAKSSLILDREKGVVKSKTQHCSLLLQPESFRNIMFSFLCIFFQTYSHKRLCNKDCTIHPGRHSHHSTGTCTTLRQVRSHTARRRPDLLDISQQNCVRNAVYQKER